MIDEEGFRLNVGIILVNHERRLLWARRVGQNAWQFPQGGIQEHESPEQALYRELAEEIGLAPNDVQLIGTAQDWLHYRLPKRLIRYYSKPICVGQKQKWFMLRLLGDDSKVCLDKCEPPEFDHWCWVSYWYPLREVVAFKRRVYQSVLKEFAPILFSK